MSLSRGTAIVGVVVVGLSAACHASRDAGSPSGEPLTDGCYYVDKTPVFRMTGGEGRMLVSGTAQRFRAVAEGNALRFTPPFLFDGSPPGLVTEPFDVGVASFRFPMKTGAAGPIIRMNMAAYGYVDVVRGPAC